MEPSARRPSSSTNNQAGDHLLATGHLSVRQLVTRPLWILLSVVNGRIIGGISTLKFYVPSKTYYANSGILYNGSLVAAMIAQPAVITRFKWWQVLFDIEMIRLSVGNDMWHWQSGSGVLQRHLLVVMWVMILVSELLLVLKRHELCVIYIFLHFSVASISRYCHHHWSRVWVRAILLNRCITNQTVSQLGPWNRNNLLP